MSLEKIQLNLELGAACFIFLLALAFFAMSVLAGLNMLYPVENQGVFGGIVPTITAIISTVLFMGSVLIFRGLKKEKTSCRKYENFGEMAENNWP
ncbi:hypothetical protein COB87_002735 [Candidatus Wolfebacteria bacterium]|nr:hypothetical protein [Candidatus Wolfebacteria bacterium]